MGLQHKGDDDMGAIMLNLFSPTDLCETSGALLA